LLASVVHGEVKAAVLWIVSNVHATRVFVERTIQKSDEAATTFGILPEIHGAQQLNAAKISHVSKGVAAVAKIVKGKQHAFSEEEWRQLVAIRWVNNAAPNLLILIITKLSRGGEDHFRKMGYREKGAVQSL
jgi:hypothetical protein